MKNKILLVALHSEYFPLIGESHGVCAIAGYLQSKVSDIDVTIMDMQLNKPEDVLAFIANEHPTIVGFSVKLQTFDNFSFFYKEIISDTSNHEQPLIVIGNSVANYGGEKILKEYASDIIISVGEGELAFYDLYMYRNGNIELSDVRNIIYMENNIIKKTKREWLSQDEFVLPYRLNSKKFYNLNAEVYIEGSRGCPYSMCSICSCADFLGSRNKCNQWRARKINYIVEDMNILQNQGIKEVTFADEDFFCRGEESIIRGLSLANELLKNNNKVNFRINTRVDFIYNMKDSYSMREIKKNMLQMIKDAGLVKIFLGLESGVKSQLIRYNKGFTLEEFEEAVKVLEELDIEYELGFILFDPLMNIEELRENIRYIENKKLINHISSIFKELRILINIDYIKRLHVQEMHTGKKLLGGFDFNSQTYNLKAYIDDDIGLIAELMREWVGIGYKVYYILRIQTQYRYFDDKTDTKKLIFFNTISNLKFLEFKLIKEFVRLIDQKQFSYMNAKYILKNYELERRKLIRTVEPCIEKKSIPIDFKLIIDELEAYYLASRYYEEKLEM